MMNLNYKLVEFNMSKCPIPGIKNYMLDTMNGRCDKLTRDTCIQNYNLYADHEKKLMNYFDTKIKNLINIMI